MKPIFLYVTVPSKKEAEKIIGVLLTKKLAACVNYYPIKSQYLWNGKVEKAKEYALIVKTMEDKVQSVEEKIKNIHPYKIPCITKISVKPNAEYAAWLARELA